MLLKGIGHKRQFIHPNAKMLVNAVVKIDAFMYFVRFGQHDVAVAYRIDRIVNEKSHVAAKMNVYLVKIVYVLGIVIGIVNVLKILLVINVGQKRKSVRKYSLRRWSIRRFYHFIAPLINLDVFMTQKSYKLIDFLHYCYFCCDIMNITNIFIFVKYF